MCKILTEDVSAQIHMVKKKILVKLTICEIAGKTLKVFFIGIMDEGILDQE